MKNTQTVSTTFSPKKIALLVTGLLAVVVLGIFLGRGNFFKGSFIGSESATIPAPTNVKITQNAAKQFILSWDYDKDAEAKSFLTYTNAAGATVPAVAFGWVIQDATSGTVIGSDDVLKDTSSTLEAVCNVKLADDGMRETVDGYICHDVVLSDAIAAELLKGKGNIIKVRAYTGVTALTDPADPQLYVRQLSMAGTGEYMLPMPAAKPVDMVGFDGDNIVTGIPHTIYWTWNDPNYRAENTNSLFADHFSSYFGYAWELTDITDRDHQVTFFKKGVFDNPDTLMVPAGQPFTNEATLKECSVNPSGFTGNIWSCKSVYIPASIPGFVNGHIYTATVVVYNGVKDATGALIPSSPTTSEPFTVTAAPPTVTPPGALDNLDVVPPAKEGDLVTFNYGWIDRGIEPSATTTTFKDAEGNYQFVYEAFVQEWNTGKVVWHNNFGIPPSQHATLITGYAPPKPVPAPTVAGYESCITTIDGVQAWVCQKGYVPSDISLTPGKTYSLTVNAYSNPIVTYQSKSNSQYQTYKTFVMPDFTPKLTPPGSLDDLSVTLPATKDDLVTYTYGWIDRGIEPSATTTAFKDAAGNYQFVYSVMILDDAGKVVWNNERGAASSLGPVPGFENCRADVNSKPAWVCQKGYVPSTVTLTPGKTYTLRVAPYFSDVNGTTTSAQFAEKAFTMPITQPAPLDTLELLLPQKKGDVLAFNSGWSTGKVTPSSTNSTFIDTKGNSQFVYSSSIQDDAGKIVWFSEDNLSLGVAKLLAGYETCAGVLHTVTPATGGMSYWDCSKNYVPADVTATFVAGKTYTLKTSLRADLTSPLVEPLSKTFVMPDLTPVNPTPTDTTAPKVVSATPLTQNKVKVIFSEPVKLPATPESAFSIQENSATKDVLKVVSVNPDPSDATGTTYILLTADPKSSTAYVITASKTITDLAGNTIVVGTSDSASFTSPAAGVTVPPTMTLKNLSVKKLTDGNVAVTYTIDVGGSSIDTIGSEVRLNDSKTFVAKFTEGVKTGVTSYTYEAILLPWEIAPGDTVKIVMNSTGVVVTYVNDGQTVTYKSDAQIQDAVVGLVTANALPAATVGSPYSTAIVVKNGVSPYKYVLAATSTLPDGLTLDSLTGVLSGTPTKDGSYSFSLSVTDAKNTALNANFTLKIVPAPVAGTVTTTVGGTTIINNYTTYSGTGGLPYVPYVAPVLPSNRYLFPINLGLSRFEDVAYHWARNYINVLWNAGYVQGYNVRKFGPDDSLTRGQLLKIVMESLHYKLPTKVAFNPCVDVQTNMWYAKYFAVAREKGIIGGYVDGTCRPNKLTNRAESLKILYAAIAQMPELPVTKITPTVPAGYRNAFYDLNEGSWYYPYFANAQSLGIISGFADETARPDSELSRAQMAKIVVLMMQKLAWDK